MQLSTHVARLTPWALCIYVLLALARSPSARAERPTVRANFETAVYQDNTATTVLTPAVAGTVDSPTGGWTLSGRYLVDVVSAASPDIVSTASPNWWEVRNAGGINGRYKPKDTGVTAGAVASHTPDYLSLGGTVGAIQDLDNKNLTLFGTYGFQRDTIGRTGVDFSVFSRTLDVHSFAFGATRVLSPSAVFTLTADVQLERGDQSKPYRYIPLFSATRAEAIGPGASGALVNALRLEEKPLEQLPTARERLALTGRLAHRSDGNTLRLEERVYADTWSQIASTTDLRYIMDVGTRFRVWPHMRMHVQTPVSFWQRTYVSAGAADIPILRTGDRELGALISGNFGLGGRMALSDDARQWALTATLDANWTHFFDALYIRQRLAVIGVLNVEAEF